MNGAKFAWCCFMFVFCLLNLLPTAKALSQVNAIGITTSTSTTTASNIGANENARNGSINYCYEPIDGLKVNYSNNELIVKYLPYDYAKQENAVSGRNNEGGKDNKQKKGNVMHRIGSMMMMVPIGLQLISIPMQLASVKMTLIRSILVAKVALTMLLLRLLFSAHKPPEKIVVVRTPPKEVHEHFYHPMAGTKDSEPNWLDHPSAWK